MPLSKQELIEIRDNYKPHGLLTGGNMTYPEQIDLLLQGKTLAGHAYPSWALKYAKLGDDGYLICDQLYYNGGLLGEHYIIQEIYV